MTQLIHSRSSRAEDIKEISIQFKEISALAKFLPATETQIIDRLRNVIDDLNNPKILRTKMLKLAIAPRWVS